MSRYFVIAVGVGVLCAATMVWAERAEKNSGKRFVITAVIPADNTLLPKSQKDEIVRIIGRAPVGVDLAIEGPAANEVVQNLLSHVKVGSPIKGEFELKATGKGTVQVRLTTSCQTTSTTAEATKTTYEFEVK